MVYFLVVHWVRDPVQLRKQPLKISLVQSFSIAITRTGWGFKERPLPTTERKTSTDIERPTNGGDQEKITTNNTAPRYGDRNQRRSVHQGNRCSPFWKPIRNLQSKTRRSPQRIRHQIESGQSNTTFMVLELLARNHFHDYRVFQRLDWVLTWMCWVLTEFYRVLPSFSTAWSDFDLVLLGVTKFYRVF